MGATVLQSAERLKVTKPKPSEPVGRGNAHLTLTYGAPSPSHSSRRRPKRCQSRAQCPPGCQWLNHVLGHSLSLPDLCAFDEPTGFTRPLERALEPWVTLREWSCCAPEKWCPSLGGAGCRPRSCCRASGPLTCAGDENIVFTWQR